MREYKGNINRGKNDNYKSKQQSSSEGNNQHW